MYDVILAYIKWKYNNRHALRSILACNIHRVMVCKHTANAKHNAAIFFKEELHWSYIPM